MMLRSEREGRVFHFRVVGICRVGGRILLHRAAKDAYWTLPGGRVEMGESTHDALRREMVEEIGEAVTIGRTSFVAENFFTLREKRFHEIDVGLEMHLAPDSRVALVESFPSQEEGSDVTFAWISELRRVLDALPLLPAFLPEALTDGSSSIRHILHHGNGRA